MQSRSKSGRFSLSSSDNKTYDHLVLDGLPVMSLERLFRFFPKPKMGLNKTEAKKLRNLIVKVLNEAAERGEFDVEVKQVR